MDSKEEDMKLLLTYSENLWRYITPLLVFPGIIGNAVCIITLQTKSFHGSATAFLLTALAVVDTVSLLVGALHVWLVHVTDFDFQTVSDAACRTHTFLTYLSVQLSAWTLVLVTLERVVSVTCPMEASTLCSRRRLVGIWVVVLCILSSLNAYLHLANMELREQFFSTMDNGTIHVRECTVRQSVSEHLKDMLEHFRVWSDLALSCLLPATLILFGNVIVICKLAQISRRKRRLQNQRGVAKDGTGRANKRKSSRITVMLITVGIVFLITSLPINILLLGEDIWFSERFSDPLVVARRELVYTILSLIYYFNNSFNFLLYFISGTMFRKAAVELFCPGLKSRYKNLRKGASCTTKTNNDKRGQTETAL